MTQRERELTVENRDLRSKIQEQARQIAAAKEQWEATNVKKVGSGGDFAVSRKKVDPPIITS